MATAQEIITRALRKGHVLANGEAAPPEVLAAALDTFNDMLESWRDEGIDFGLVTLALSSPVAVDAGATRAIVYNLAVELANDEHASVPSKTEQIAQVSKSGLANRMLARRAVRFPTALTHRTCS